MKTTRRRRAAARVRPALTALALLALTAAALLGLPAAALLGLPAPAAAQEAAADQETADAPRSFRYRLELTTPSASAPAVWTVFQDAEGAAVVPPGRPADPDTAWAIVHREETAGRPYQIRREQGELVPVWSPDREYRPGVEVDAQASRLELRDLSWEMIRGSSDRRVAGRPTEHYVITASLKMVARPAPGLEGLGTDSTVVASRTDLWVDRGLAFSWAPFAIWGGRALTLGHPVADAGLRGRAEARLRELGLPLRMQTRITYRPFGDPDFAFGQNSRTEAQVTELQPADPPAVPSRFLRYALTSPPQ